MIDQTLLRKLGELTWLFNILEMLVHNAVWRALGLDPRSGRAITQTMSIDALRQLLDRMLDRGLVTDTELAEAVARLSKALGGVDGVIQRRNRYVHSFVYQSPEGGAFTIPVRDWLRSDASDIKLAAFGPVELQQLIDDIYGLLSDTAGGFGFPPPFVPTS